jgi:hypothetical protein
MLCPYLDTGGLRDPRCLRDDPPGRENYAFSQREQFIQSEDRVFLRLASAPHAPLVRP